jgi:hypothetical protein
MVLFLQKRHDRNIVISSANPYANMFKSLNAEGKADFVYTGVNVEVPSMGGTQPLFLKGDENPISGQSDFERIREEYDDADEIINVATGPNRPAESITIDSYNDISWVAAKFEDFALQYTYSFTGDAGVAFQVGDEISLSGIIPALNYPQYHGTVDGTTDYLDPYYLNGLKVKILSFNSTTKEYSVEVKFDDWEVRANKRWCGNIIMPADNDLVIKDGVTVTLNKTGTPNRRTPDAVHGFFQPTVLTIEDGASIKLNSSSCLLVDDYSTLIIKSGAEVIIEEGAQLHVKGNGKIILEDGGIIKITYPSGKILIEDDGTLQMNGNNIQLNNLTATIQLNSGGIIQTADYVDFTFTGTGYLDYYEGGEFDMGEYAKFVIDGAAETELKIKLNPFADLYIPSHDVQITDCKLLYDNSSKFRVAFNEVTLRHVDFVASNNSFTPPSNAMWAYDTKDFLAEYCEVDGFISGMKFENIESCPGSINVNLNYCVFTNQKDISIEAYDVQRMKLYYTYLTGNVNAIAGLFLQNVNECTVQGGTIKYYDKTGDYHAGIWLNNVTALFLDAAIVQNCDGDGIEAWGSNIFLRNKATLKLNGTGIRADSRMYGESTPALLHKIVVGDKGCGWIVNNAIAITATDMMLEIDQVVHANASANPFDIHHNRFDGNTFLFDVCYNYYASADISNPIPANGNWWGSSGIPSTSIYDIGWDAYCNNVTLYYEDDRPSTQPSNCNCMLPDFCKTNPTESDISLRLSQTSCNSSINKQGGGRITIAEQYRLAMIDFTSGAYNTAWQKFNWLNNRVSAEYPQGFSDGICKALWRSSYWYADPNTILAEVNCLWPFYEKEDPVENTYTTQFVMYPNPGKNIVIFSALQETESKYSIFTLSGELVTSGSMQGGITIDVSNYPKGLYFVLFKDENNEVIEMQKLVLQ